MKILATLVLVAAMATLGCSNSDQASAGGNENVDLSDNAGKTQVTARTTQAVSAKPSSKGITMAPSWQVVDIAGNEVTDKDFAGKIQIIDFWATWCGPCKMEIPHFIELQNEYKDDLVIIGMALDQVARVVPFSKQFKINYTNLIADQKVARDFGVGRSIPTTYVIAQDGQIFRRYVGFRPKEVFESDIKALLAKAQS